MAIDRERARQCLKDFDIRKLFIDELGWDKFSKPLTKQIDGCEYSFRAVAEKRGVVVLVCDAIPEYAIRVKLDKLIAKDHFEHLIVFADKAQGRQAWQWFRKEPGKPVAVRTYRFTSGQSGELVLQKLENLAFTLSEEETLTLGDVTGRLKTLDVEKVTKKFYERFKTEHATFLSFIKGIPDEHMEAWYASVMVNRLMFLYFIQEKGFLNGDKDYLRNKLAESHSQKPDAYYRDFLTTLFFQGFARKKEDRSAATNKLLGEIPYLNGGLFQPHQIEQLRGKDIQIADKAFTKLFDFFKEYNWHLDERENRSDREINPDVLGYIFEKYINQKQMGAYYTKEDITEYMSQNTVIPFLLDRARADCAVAFDTDGSVWRLLRDDPDRYIHDAMKQGANQPLPPEIAAGIGNVKKRTGWNRAADEEFALPTEIWRESIERIQRYRNLHEKLAAGEVNQVNDLVTLNLNIRQFAQDVVQFCEGPELLRALWKAIREVSILDPTCGSGAFLFAALNILRPLYDACLLRMQGFIEDMEAAGKHHPAKFQDFKDVLAESARHPKQDYFILKSIIINNLYGVDIMEEAVEICKLRLFLKLVAQVESQDRIEPLPDIDFNIRAGNTLVGYARYDDVKKAAEMRFSFGDDIMSRIDDRLRTLDAAVAMFRRQQTDLGGDVTALDKAALDGLYKELETELDDFLAAESGVKKAGLKKWRADTNPFHWFCDFHPILGGGGFDIIIGNPPYVEYKDVLKEGRYTLPLANLRTGECGNLYAYTFERCMSLVRDGGRTGLIIPVASVSTDGYSSLRTVLRNRGSMVISSFNDRPAKLFDGLEHIRLSIVLHRADGVRMADTTSYLRWSKGERDHLFKRLQFSRSPLDLVQHYIPKLGNCLADSIFQKIHSVDSLPLSGCFTDSGAHSIFYTRKLSHFVQILSFVPKMVVDGKKRDPSELKSIGLADARSAGCALSVLNSSLFYWLLNATSDCRNLNRREIDLFPIDINSLSQSHAQKLQTLSEKLMDNFKANAQVVSMDFKKHGKMRIECVYPRLGKDIIDEIDCILAKHYGLTDEELDFVLNYDIKYRLGADAEEDVE
jgi:hypothetical protein